MSTAKELVQNYMGDVWVNRKVETLGQYISASHFIQHNPHLEDGLEALQGFLQHGPIHSREVDLALVTAGAQLDASGAIQRLISSKPVMTIYKGKVKVIK